MPEWRMGVGGGSRVGGEVGGEDGRWPPPPCQGGMLFWGDEMVLHAQQMGESAILGGWYDAAEVVSSGNATEVLCYGTAVA
ncbi:MAG: heavy metal-binding domain-containing protein [Verrucomicrobia bacterium]|nr:heavy metal-binding domain-containing protein [Verrucomicrobiota bacterium]